MKSSGIPQKAGKKNRMFQLRTRQTVDTGINMRLLYPKFSSQIAEKCTRASGKIRGSLEVSPERAQS
jgi:hypothetical protein